MTTIVSEFEGLDDIGDYFKAMPKRTKTSLRLAINRTVARTGMKAIQDEMYDQVNFPKNYLSGDRLFVQQYATESNLEGVILGRKRATSLARFAAPGTPLGYRGKQGVTVKVSSGGSVHLRDAYLVRLRRGASLTEDNFNVGLALRVKPGESIVGKKSMHRSWLVPGAVALLYGPSVNQVFEEVAETKGPELLGMVADEFFRQFERQGQ